MGSFDPLGTCLREPPALVFFLHVASKMHGLKVPRCGRVAAVDQGNDVVKGRAERMPRPKPEQDLLIAPGADRAGYAVGLD